MFRETCSIQLKGQPFTLTVSGDLDVNKDSGEADMPNLHISLTSNLNGDEWGGSYTAEYVEEISKKTGNYKKFPIFMEMLLSAMVQTSKIVGLDLLTAQDLDLIKQGTDPTKEKRAPAGKVYLILTYAVAFDRVHYPLPLLPKEKPANHQSVKATVASYKREIDDLKLEKLHFLEEIARLTKENDRLRHEVKLSSVSSKYHTRSSRVNWA
ncbi:hypothetical protein HDU76_001364 [Blyttiomyces sp. JEL0837]|nr:hypothetical protein HDU76_001364 [Blyttiomyces sp. JEL0837]